MKNKIQNGNVLSLTAPYVRLSGEGVLVGSIFGVAVNGAANGAALEAVVVGVFNIKKKTADVVAIGDKLYWDDTLKELTITSTANTLAGLATAAADGSATTVDCRLSL